MVTQHAALTGGSAVPKILAYQGPGTTTDFAPKVFVDVAPFMDRKVALLHGFNGYHLENLSEEIVRATALYWGRFAGHEEVEPLEILRG